jgi:hypothetical protein
MDQDIKSKSDVIYEKLSELTNKKNNYIVKRGNEAILYSLKIAKWLGFKEVYIADQGGWLTYKHFPIRLKLNLNILKSNYGLVNENSIKSIRNSVLLLNSCPGYCCYQDFSKIKKISDQNKNIIIEDITATIGDPTNNSNIGDILVASFGKGKIVDYGMLGLISFDDKFQVLKVEEEQYDKELLAGKIDNIQKRKKTLTDSAKKIKSDLKHFQIIHKDHDAINVIVKFNNMQEYDKIVEYCISKGLEFVECPKYIKVLDNAISIEVKKTG